MGRFVLYNKGMSHIIDNKIYHDGQEIGWIDGTKVRAEGGNKVLGFIGTEHVYDSAMHKIAYIENDILHFENGQPTEYPTRKNK